MPTRLSLALICAVSVTMPVQAQKPAWQPPHGLATVNLWPGAAPGTPATYGPEFDNTKLSDNLIAGRPVIRLAGVSVPTLTIYPAKGVNTGAAVVVFPGGGYRILAIDLEGTEVCDWLTGIGVTCILVKYRVPGSTTEPMTGPYPKSNAALQDAQRAMGFVRTHAADYHIDPKRIGVLGFSAGGHLSVALSNLYKKRIYEKVDAADNQSCRPDFAVVVYPGYLADEEHSFLDQLEIHPAEDTPPTFLVQAEDDPVHVENSTTYFLALKKAKVPAELHLFAKGGHGYGLRKTELPVTTWPQIVETWMHTIQILK